MTEAEILGKERKAKGKLDRRRESIIRTEVVLCSCSIALTG